jgi:hypothetical protein
MILKLKVNDGTYDTELYFNVCASGTKDDLIREIRGYVSEFKTYCIVNRKPYVIPHFVNWMNKYTDYSVTFGVPSSGRIDF